HTRCYRDWSSDVCSSDLDSGGWAEDVSDAEIAEAMVLLGRTEGVFAETAGGVTVAVARKLIEQGRIPRDEEIVLCITGNGLKTRSEERRGGEGCERRTAA